MEQDLDKLNNRLHYVLTKSLLDYRNYYHLSQQQLADKLNVTQPYISKLERGYYDISIKQISYLITRLNDNEFQFRDKLLTDITKVLKY